MARYTRWRFTLPREQEGLFSAALWSAGCLGIHEPEGFEDAGRQCYEVYFPLSEDSAPPALDLERWRRRGVEAESPETISDLDWLAGYRASSPQIEVGRGFLVDPRLPTSPAAAPAFADPDAASGRVALRIPAQTAFGTGSHESTRLLVRWLEEIDVAGLDVLDVGTGSGILSFVAEILGAQGVTAFDRDPQAVCIARRNARLNRGRLDKGRLNARSPRIFAGRLAALRPRPAFDLALVNILPEHILSELPQLTTVLRPGARVIHSGNLWDWRQDLLDSFAAAGLRCAGEKRENDWVAFLLTLEAAG